MRIPVSFSFKFVVATPLCLALAIPVATLAAGDPAKPAPAPKAAASKPDTQKRVWTNDDVEQLNPAFDPNAPRNSAVASSQPAAAEKSVLPAAIAVVPSAPLDPQKDPGWYAQQLVSLQAEQAAIASREDDLRQFRASGDTISTSGLVLNAPCEGITTDNLIAQLEARRQEIEQQIDSLADVARSNGILPGVLADPASYAPGGSQPDAEERRVALAQQVQEASDQLAQVHGVVADMQDQQAAQNMTLLPPTPGNGGNMTTDLLERLDNRANALQSEINNAEDAARSQGVPPGDLR
jgi:hypothetical protein